MARIRSFIRAIRRLPSGAAARGQVSQNAKVLGLLFGCLLGGVYALVLLLGSGTGVPALRALQQPVAQPPLQGKAFDVPSLHLEREYAQVLRYRQYLDSLSRTASGRKYLERLQLARPGLTDSVLLVEYLYHLHTKPIP